MFKKLDKFVDPNNAWVRTAGWIVLALFAAGYQAGNLFGAIGCLGLGLLSLLDRYGRRLETLEAEIGVLRAQLAGGSLPADQVPGQG